MKIETFEPSKLEQSIDDALKYPNYNTLFAVDTETGIKLDKHKDKHKLKYITNMKRPYSYNISA